MLVSLEFSLFGLTPEVRVWRGAFIEREWKKGMDVSEKSLEVQKRAILGSRWNGPTLAGGSVSVGGNLRVER